MKIFFCKKCRTLDYAAGSCSKCGSTEIDEATIEFLAFGSCTNQTPDMQILLTGIHPIEKIGWN